MARTRSRKRTKLFTGVYEDKYGIAIPIRGKEHRYPLGTPNEQLRKERDRLREEAGPAPTRRGTIAIEAEAYLRTLPEGLSREVARTELQPWIDVFGARASGDLTPIEIKQQRAAWLTKGPRGKALSKKHLNNLLYRLRAMYATNHGRDLNPAADVPILTVQYTDHRAFSDEVVDLIIGSMADTAWPLNPKTKAPPPNGAKLRLRAFRETGFPPAMLKRIRDHHIDPRAGTCYTEMRLKGRGVVGATLPVTKRGMAALRALQRAKLLGAFSTRSLSQAFDRGVARARELWEAREATKKRPRPWPLRDDVTMYDLRHIFGTVALLENDGDLEAVATLMRHANINTTRRYLQAASDARARITVQKLNRGGRLP